MKILFVLLVLAGLSFTVYMYRDQIKEWLPGLKAYILNGSITLAGVLAPILDYLGKVDFQAWLTKENAALAAVAVGILGILISMVTKRAE